MPYEVRTVGALDRLDDLSVGSVDESADFAADGLLPHRHVQAHHRQQPRRRMAQVEAGRVIYGTAPDPEGTDIAVQVERRRRALADSWSLDDELVLIGAGNRLPVPGRGDLTYPFRAHSEYLYLTDRERPGGVSPSTRTTAGLTSSRR